MIFDHEIIAESKELLSHLISHIDLRPEVSKT